MSVRAAALLLLLALLDAERAQAADAPLPKPAPIALGPAGPLAGVEEIVFAVRQPANYHYYENFGHFVSHVRQCYAPPEQAEAGPPAANFHEGGRLCRLNLVTGDVQVLVDDPTGGMRDPCVDYDGRTIVFSYRRGGEDHYRLYRIGSDGKGLAQLTDGPYDDIEPCILPHGGMLFCSSRARRTVGCWPAPVATLYRCDSDGRNVEAISASPFTDNTPWMLADGRVLFTRWEYVDRNQLSFHHLWTMNPDGTEVRACFGNQYTGADTPIPRFSDYAMLDAKPIPGSAAFVASFSPDHGRGEHLGYITVVDPSLGPDAMASARQLRRDKTFRDPYPLSADCFLVADVKGIWSMDGSGQTQLVYQLPPDSGKLECHEPRPLAPRPREAALAGASSRHHERQAAAEQRLSGPQDDGDRRGQIKQLLVLEQLPKPVQFSGGQEPLTIGGPFTLTRVLGTVPVEEDGSAYFEAPALRSLFFAALDANGLAVKRMHSFVSVMPGETIGCVGCHEARNRHAGRGEHAGGSTATAQPDRAHRGRARGLRLSARYPADPRPALHRVPQGRPLGRACRPERRPHAALTAAATGA